MAHIGIVPGGSDQVHRVRGVGGFEFVYSKTIDSIVLDTMELEDFKIHVGAMNHGFPLQGLVGMDFLRAARAVLDFGALEVRASAD